MYMNGSNRQLGFSKTENGMGKGSEDNEHKQWEIKVFYTPILHKRHILGGTELKSCKKA